MDYTEVSAEELFEKFLDEDSCEKKLELFSALREKITPQMLDNIAASLDIITAGKSLEDDCNLIEYHLRMQGKFEVKRFR